MSEGNTFLTSCLFESELAFFCRVQVTAVAHGQGHCNVYAVFGDSRLGSGTSIEDEVVQYLNVIVKVNIEYHAYVGYSSPQ